LERDCHGNKKYKEAPKFVRDNLIDAIRPGWIYGKWLADDRRNSFRNPSVPGISFDL
jgi:hypothetical protein